MRSDPQEVLRNMAGALIHRGPDDGAIWHDAAHGIGLAHRRLAIIDLSEHGRQPMVSHCGRYVIILNGEIYNFPELRKELGHVPWRGHSDTEILLECFTRYGIRATLDKIVGMFAFAVWDTREGELTLVRDRIGEKPLYYGVLGSNDFVFGSELRALRAYPTWSSVVDREALTLLLRHNCVPAPWSIYEKIKKLKPGCFLTVRQGGRIEHGTYWSALDVAKQGCAHLQKLPDGDAIDRLDMLLGRAVNEQMVADVPVGAFLSGGIDSSAIVALMTRAKGHKVRTFSIGFSEPGFNEAEHAKIVAQHLQTEHTELYVTAADALAVVPKLPAIYDEPFADSSQIPTFLVAQMARQQVTVVLSGDAGDELFGGYTRYLLAPQLWRQIARVPVGLRRWASRRLLSMRLGTLDDVIASMTAVLPNTWPIPPNADRLQKAAAGIFQADSQAEMYRALLSHWQDPAAVVVDGQDAATLLQEQRVQNAFEGPLERMGITDQLTYLPDDILVKVDRAAMAVSLETRLPFLDHRIVEFAWQLPAHQKIRLGETKWILRQVLYRYVPRSMIERPKQGFGVPLAAWLRGPLRDWAESLLAPEILRQQGFFDACQVREKWDEHVSGRRNWPHLLWNALMFQAWLEQTQAN
jgi:asparagine synthase (glutamine-hydrolysing)